MFYFFERDQQYRRCEIRSNLSGYAIVISEPDGHERVEIFATSQAAHERWKSLQDLYHHEGWSGPFGRGE